MELRTHLCAPIGEATRREIAKTLEVVKADNAYWISALINSGKKPPCCAKSMDIDYRPPVGSEAKTSTQEFYSAPFMFTRGHGACGDIHAYDAAAMEVLFRVPTKILVPAQGATSYHVVMLTPAGPMDRTKNWKERKCNCHLLGGSARSR